MEAEFKEKSGGVEIWLLQGGGIHSPVDIDDISANRKKSIREVMHVLMEVAEETGAEIRVTPAPEWPTEIDMYVCDPDSKESIGAERLVCTNRLSWGGFVPVAGFVMEKKFKVATPEGRESFKTRMTKAVEAILNYEAKRRPEKEHKKRQYQQAVSQLETIVNGPE